MPDPLTVKAYERLKHDIYRPVRSQKVKQLTATALFAAIICVAAPVSIPAPAIPLSLATLAVMLAGALLGPARGTAAVSLYLIIGSIGIPVFAGFKGGFAVLAGPTGGYLAGYIALAFICGMSRMIPSSSAKGFAFILTALCICGTIVLYTLGTIWYCVISSSTPASALVICIVPFLPGDSLKISMCVAFTVTIKRRSLFEIFR